MTQADTADPAPANEPVPGSDEYNAMMAAKFRNEGDDTDTEVAGNPGEDPAPTDGQVEPMPEGGVDKFYNAETGVYDWASHGKEAAYRAAQAAKDDTPAAAPELEAEEAGEQSGDDNAEASDIVIKAGLDPAALQQEIVTSGKINDDARAALNKQGISDSIIDAFVRGIVAETTAARAAGLEYVGGEEVWSEVQAFVKSNFTESEKNSFREALKGDSWQLAVDGVKARMAKAKSNGEGTLTVGNQPGSSAPAGYTSRSQMQQDMNDPRYTGAGRPGGPDPAFQRQVMVKMQNATWSDEGGSLF